MGHMREIAIGDRKVGPNHPPLIVAEISANHSQSLEKAVRLIHAAKAAGADAVKFQTYTPDSMTVDCEKDPYMHFEGLWKGYSLYRLYQNAYTPYEWFETLFKEAKEAGILLFSSAFDPEAVDLLEKLGAPCYKIASLELVYHQLIRRAAETGKPVLLSTGASTLEEIQEAVSVVRSTGNEQIVLLKCVSAYPTPIQECNLATIPDLYTHFETPIGLSDHTKTPFTSILSVALGGCLIEKHFILAKGEGELDAPFSLDPQEMRNLVEQAALAYQARGSVHYGPTPHEKDTFKYRRSLICTKDIEKGGLLTQENVKPLRPAIGLPPKYLESILGKRAKKKIERGDPITWDVIS